MPEHRTATREEWTAARTALLTREKELTRMGDELARERGRHRVYHCYSSYARATEFLMGYYAILDRAPTGRDEGDQPMDWLRRHDEYRLAEGGMP